MTDPSLSARSVALPLRRLALALVAGNVAVILVLLLAASLALRAGRASEEARARESAENLANSLAIELGAELKQLDNALSTVALRVRAVDATQPGGRAEIERSLAEQRSLLPQVDAIRVADENGIVHLGIAANAETVSIADRDYFLEAKAHDGMVVSEPIQGRIVRKWGVAVARRLHHADGSFAGVAYTNLSSDRFVGRFKGIGLGSAGAVSLRSGGLRLIARYSVIDGAQEKNLGTVIISEEMTRRLAADPERGSYLTPTALDSIERYTAYQRIPGCALRVFVGLGTSDFLAGWRREAGQMAALLAIAIATIAGFSAVLFVQQRRQVIARREIARLAQEQSVMLDNEIVGMVKLKDRVAVWKNRALDRIFGYAPHELVGAPARLLYLDDDSFDDIGRRAYPMLRASGRFRAQLRMRHKQGHAIWIDLTGAAVSADESLWSMTDITALKDSEAHAHHLALHDPMTGLPNRLLFAERLLYILADAQRRRQMTGVCYLDLDGFKAVNDAHGHDAGDAVLNEVAKRLLGCIRTNDVVARFGGDEFALILSNIQDAREVERVLQRVLQAIEQPIHLARGEVVAVGASIGVAIGPEHGDDSDALTARADQAMYVAKRAGKHRVVLWSP
jgi:diguanylate cyclase (GGDEF)-like protein/PAS domain S-box-containing protein